MLFLDLEVFPVGEDIVRVVLVTVESRQDSQGVVVTVLIDHWP